MNAILVSEMRQAVRSRAVVAMILLALLAVCSVVLACLLDLDVRLNDIEASVRAGRSMFSGLYAAVVLVCMVCVPLYVGVRLAMECTGDSPDLYLFTSVTAHQIARGKIQCGAAMVAILLAMAVGTMHAGRIVKIVLGVVIISAAACVVAFVVNLPWFRKQWLQYSREAAA